MMNPPLTEICRVCGRPPSVSNQNDRRLIVRRKPSHLAGIVLGIVAAIMLFGAFPLDMAPSRQLAALPWILVTWLFVVYVELVRDSRVVEIDPDGKRVVERARSWRWRLRTFEYPLSQFRSVVSYTAPGRPSRNFVELVTHAGGESFHVVAFDPAFSSESLLLPLRYVESPEAEHLRKTIAALCSLEDRGYLGRRWPGAYVKSRATSPLGHNMLHDEPARHL